MYMYCMSRMLHPVFLLLCYLYEKRSLDFSLNVVQTMSDTRIQTLFSCAISCSSWWIWLSRLSNSSWSFLFSSRSCSNCCLERFEIEHFSLHASGKHGYGFKNALVYFFSTEICWFYLYSSVSLHYQPFSIHLRLKFSIYYQVWLKFQRAVGSHNPVPETSYRPFLRQLCQMSPIWPLTLCRPRSPLIYGLLLSPLAPVRIPNFTH